MANNLTRCRNQRFRTGFYNFYDIITHMKKPVECLKCQYYQVTWDPRLPRGCRFYGFKSSRLPSQVVLESSGEPCKGFKPRGRRDSP